MRMRENGVLIRKFEKCDLYDGILVVSKGNWDTIYELRGVNTGSYTTGSSTTGSYTTELEYKAVYRIQKHGDVLRAAPLKSYWSSTGTFTEYWETEWTMKLDRVKIREKKLNELLSETEYE